MADYRNKKGVRARQSLTPPTGCGWGTGCGIVLNVRIHRSRDPRLRIFMAGRHVISYAEGDVYDGEWSNDGKRHGRGMLTFASGAKYSGEFVNGFFQGVGVLAFPDGGRYEGQFELGKYQGLGVFISRDGMKFEVGCHLGLWK